MATTNERLPLTDWLAHTAVLVNHRLDTILSVEGASSTLTEAMRYAVLSGGKRLRPAMLFAVAEEDGNIPPSAIDAACALELIHCYSLVHDDLPCMDNDDERRGRPTCHKVYGESMALLAGDCLHSLAFEMIAASRLPMDACTLLAKAAGSSGMGGGQAIDIAGVANHNDSIATMHQLKTGALFKCALYLGTLCRKDSTAVVDKTLTDFGQDFGLLFQIANDINDQHQDKRAGKTTYATLSVAEARQRAVDIQTKIIQAVENRFPRLAAIATIVYSAP